MNERFCGRLRAVLLGSMALLSLTACGGGGSGSGGSRATGEPGPAASPTAVEEPPVVAEPQYCLTFALGGVAVLDLDSGRLGLLIDTTAPVQDGLTSSLAWLADVAYTCGEAGLIRISLRSGAWEAASVPCLAVAAFDGGLLLLADGGGGGEPATLRFYRSYAAVLSQDADRTYGFAALATRMTVQGTLYFGAGQSTDHVEVGDLSTGAPLGGLMLEREDDWVWGMAVTDDDRLVLANGDRVELFDVQTGEKLHDVPLTAPIRGLSCTTRLAPPAASSGLPLGLDPARHIVP